MAGAVGAHATPVAVLAMGVSNVLADAMSMGVGEYLSSRSYNNYVLREKEREAWELENHPEGEIDEMVELFEQRGMGHDDAVEVIKRMSKYKEFFVNIMMTEELALPVPDPEDEVNSRKEGVVMFLAFAAFGMLPIVGFVAAPLLAPSLGDAALFSVACLVTAVALFGLGAFKASFGDKAYLRSGAETLALGGICAAVAFLVGRAVSGFAEERVRRALRRPPRLLLGVRGRVRRAVRWRGTRLISLWDVSRSRAFTRGYREFMCQPRLTGGAAGSWPSAGLCPGAPPLTAPSSSPASGVAALR